MKEAFEKVYETEHWKSGQSISGSGSDLKNATVIAGRLNEFIKSHIGTGAVVVDCPCGDYNWQHLFNDDGVLYIGYDIVPALIESNKQKHPEIDFHVGDVTETNFGTGDLLIVRDCLVHIPNELVLKALENLANQDFKFVAITHFGNTRENRDTVAPHWRPTNLSASPFSLPEPYLVLFEDCQEGGGAWADKSLAVYRVADLRQRFTPQG